jgi:hypothetical protein
VADGKGVKASFSKLSTIKEFLDIDHHPMNPSYPTTGYGSFANISYNTTMTLSAKARRLFARHTFFVVGTSVLATLGLTTLAFSWQQSLLDLSTISHHWNAVSETEDTVSWHNEDSSSAAGVGNWTELEELALQLELEVEKEEEEMIMDRESGMSCREGIERKLRVAVYDFTPFHEGESRVFTSFS